MPRKSSTKTRSDQRAIRLNRFLAQVGVDSRRRCDEIIAAGRVTIDGHRVRKPGIRVVPGRERITVDGVVIDRPSRPVVLLLHKPTGVVSTVSDPQGRPTVIDLCKRYTRNRRLFPVGRLDINTTGALIVTNDGLLCYRLTHPRHEVARTYTARVRGLWDERKLSRLRQLARGKGEIEGTVDVVKQLAKVTVLKITLREGRNRQVRRMCEGMGLTVVRLKRISFGPVSLKSLPVGSVRPLEQRELDRLDRATGGGQPDGH